MKKSFLFLTAVAFLILHTSASAALIWGLEATTKSGQGDTPDNTTVTTTLAANVTGTDGAGYGASGVGLNVLDTEGSDGSNIYMRHAANNATTVIDFNTGYTQFTISADSGYTMDLTDLTFDSARGGSTGTRGFELYGVAGGTPTIGNLLVDVDDEPGTRAAPTIRSADLTGAAFQGISSVTFRYYALTNNSGRSIEVGEFQLNGSVSPIPEPSALMLLGLAGLGLVMRRRR